MTPSRRDFLRYLLATPLAMTLDVEQLLWVPSPRIVVPGLRSVTLEEINRITVETLYPGILETFFAPSPLIEYMRAQKISTVGCGEIRQRLIYVGDGAPTRDIPLTTYNDLTRRTW